MNLTRKAVERVRLATRRSRYSARKSLAKHAYIPGDCPLLTRKKLGDCPREKPGDCPQAFSHPIWSVDRQEWVPLAELADGETLQVLDGLAVVLGVTLSRVSQPVYNIEVHGAHVYQVGELGLVVHNTYYDDIVDEARKLYPKKTIRSELHHVTPKYLGGATDGPVTRIDAAYHQLMVNGFALFGRTEVQSHRLRSLQESWLRFTASSRYHRQN